MKLTRVDGEVRPTDVSSHNSGVTARSDENTWDAAGGAVANPGCNYCLILSTSFRLDGSMKEKTWFCSERNKISFPER
jgi:hypothetical protein